VARLAPRSDSMTPRADPFIHPGLAHPNTPVTAASLGERFGVGAAEVSRWIGEGLPVFSRENTADPLVDPIAACNWLCWGHLDRCPLLARRWRSWMRWFQPHLREVGSARRIRVQRHHRLYLPTAVDELHWRIPVMPGAAAVAVGGIDPRSGSADIGHSDGDEAPVHAKSALWIDARWSHATAPVFTASDDLTITPVAADALPTDDRGWLTALVDDLVAGFRYEYRLHAPGGAEPESAPRAAGSCLDLAREMGRRVGERRPWRLLGGVVATDALANPHFWIEVETVAGWLPVDPCLGAVARMLGMDWRPWTAAWIGGCDARRITTVRGIHPVANLPGGPSCGSVAGEATAVVDGESVNCWPCIDWTVGECTYTFRNQ